MCLASTSLGNGDGSGKGTWIRQCFVFTDHVGDISDGENICGWEARHSFG